MPESGESHRAGHDAGGHAAHRHGDHADHPHGEVAHDGHHSHDHRGSLAGVLASIVRPHSHDAADAVDPELEASRDGMVALAVSFGGLVATAVLQGVIAALSGSVALLADTIHNGADALTALPLGIAFVLARRRPTARYTYGYGRAEDLAGVAVLVMVAASAVAAAWQAIARLVHPRHVGHLGWVIAAGLVGAAGNELVALYRIRVGRRIGSAALEADGFHARSDGVASLGVVAGAVGLQLGWRAADPVFGLVITVAILVVIKGSAREIYRRLMDAVDPALVARIGSVVARAEGVHSVDAVRVRWIGHQLHAEVEVTSDAALHLDEAHAIGEEARHLLLHEIRRLTSVTVHSSPTPQGDDEPHAGTAHHFARRPDAGPA